MATLLSYKSWKGKKEGKEVKSAVSKLGKILLHSTVPKVPLTKSHSVLHTGRNCFNLFQISFSANTADTDPEVSMVSKDQIFCEKFKNIHCQVDYPAKIE